MGGVDASKIREGDEVDVRVTVFEKYENGRLKTSGAGAGGAWLIAISNVVAHHPKPREIKAGDNVYWRDDRNAAFVLHVQDNLAWVRGVGLIDVLNLRHVDEERSR